MNPLYMTLGIGLGMLVAGAVPPDEAGPAIVAMASVHGEVPAAPGIAPTLAPDGAASSERRHGR
jgi:hypothetical protein